MPKGRITLKPLGGAMKKYFGLMLCMFLIISCDDDVDDIIDDLKPSLGAGQILGFGGSALESAGGSFGFAPSTARSGECDDSVSDLSTDAAGIAAYLDCTLTTNSKSPDTMRGSFHLVTEVIALIEGQIDFIYGSDFTTHENISGTVDVSEGMQDVTLSLRERSVASDNWDFQIQVCILTIDGNAINTSLADCENGSFNMDIFLVSSLNQVAFKTAQYFGPTFTNGTSFVLDIDNQELRFEAWDEDSGRHQRLFADGSISADFELGSITQISMAVVSTGIETSGDGTDAIYAEYDGTNLCANIWDDSNDDHSDGFGSGFNSDLDILGMCPEFPIYEVGFFDSSTSAQSYLESADNGPLSFNALSFSIADYIAQ